MTDITITAPMDATVVAVHVHPQQQAKTQQLLLILDAMKMQHSLLAPQTGQVLELLVAVGDSVKKGQALLRMAVKGSEKEPVEVAQPSDTSANQVLLDTLLQRQGKTLDPQRGDFIAKRHQKGDRSARENLADLCDPDSFMEYGQLAVAAQRMRSDYQQLQTSTAADGIITGMANINQADFGAASKTAVVINDYSVLAGTQGYYHHQKLDRMLAQAKQQQTPVVMYTEGGGGRPGDTDVTTVNSGLQCASFASWARLSGVVPRIAVNNGYCFAGNAALFGAADITIATQSSWIGMAGPAMIEGGGLGVVRATDIGPIATQYKNGTVDIVCQDEAEATKVAKTCLSYFQGTKASYQQHQPEGLREVLPQDRRFVYDVRKVVNLIADMDSVTELKAGFGGSIITAFIRINGHSVGILASDCKVLGGAIDVAAGEKAADFINLCNQFAIPILSLCDTPGFMVGPAHEELGAVRRLSSIFTAGAQRQVPLVAVVLRKCYGLGAQALLGGSTSAPDYMLSWPNGEFGPMGLEGAVKLGFKKELAALQDADERQALYQQLLAQQYQRGQAIEVASVLEIDAVIDPADTRKMIAQCLRF